MQQLTDSIIRMYVCVLYKNSHAVVLCYKSSWECSRMVNTHPSPPNGLLRSPFIYDKVKSFYCFLASSKTKMEIHNTLVFVDLHFLKQVRHPVWETFKKLLHISFRAGCLLCFRKSRSFQKLSEGIQVRFLSMRRTQKPDDWGQFHCVASLAPHFFLQNEKIKQICTEPLLLLLNLNRNIQKPGKTV